MTNPAHGFVTDTGQTVKYTADPTWTGTDSFTYTVSNDQGGTATAKVTVTVQSNRPPVAKDDSASVAPGGSIMIDVLSNDSDPDGDTLTITGVTQPQHGTVTYTGQAVTYTGNRAWKGTDTFTYTISDGNGGTATATVTVTMAATNHLPVAKDDSASTGRSTPVTINVLANDSDPDNDTLTVTGVTSPAWHGHP